jgi:hypothetical protein
MDRDLYIYDIDGTILTFVNGHSKVDAPPIQNRIDILNKRYQDGHWIILYTRRPESNREKTIKHLKKLNVCYHSLLMEKSHQIKVIDDCEINIKFEKVKRINLLSEV